jgi:hypothetical protein
MSAPTLTRLSTGCDSSRRLGGCELGFNSGDCTVALTGANTYLSWLLSHVAACLRLSDVEAEFDQWIANTQARRAAADPGASHAGP